MDGHKSNLHGKSDEQLARLNVQSKISKLTRLINSQEGGATNEQAEKLTGLIAELDSMPRPTASIGRGVSVKPLAQAAMTTPDPLADFIKAAVDAAIAEATERAKAAARDAFLKANPRYSLPTEWKNLSHTDLLAAAQERVAVAEMMLAAVQSVIATEDERAASAPETAA
jgi:hypothetical protein